MEEQNQTNQNLERESRIEQEYEPAPQEEILKNNKNWGLIAGVIVLVLLIIGGGLYWWLQIKDSNGLKEEENIVSNELIDETKNSNETSQEKELIGDNSVNGEETKIGLAAQCNNANGIWEDGKCKAKDCFDVDARLGEDSKYFSNRIYYNGDKDFSDYYGDTHLIPNTKSDVCDVKDGQSIIREAVCPSEINILEDFLNSYIEYECEEGCDGTIESCRKKDYKVEGFKIDTLTMTHYKLDSFDGPYEAKIRPDGTVWYEWGDYAPGAALLTEQEYLEIYRSIINMDDLFTEVEDYNNLFKTDANEYYDPENREIELYSVHYIYYPEDEEENIENGKLAFFACNINCPQKFKDLVNKIEDLSPYMAASDKHWVPMFVYDGECEESGHDLACWYNVIANKRPDAFISDYDKESIFFVDIDYSLDSDGDSIPDFNEKYLGTNIYSEDTDGDGFKDLEEISGGYNPVGEGGIEKYGLKELGAILESQCIERGGKMEETSNINFNCWGIQSQDECAQVMNCMWSGYGYCKPDVWYCACNDGEKIQTTMLHKFDSSCN